MRFMARQSAFHNSTNHRQIVEIVYSLVTKRSKALCFHTTTKAVLHSVRFKAGLHPMISRPDCIRAQIVYTGI